MKVSGAMHKNAEWVPPETPLAEVAKKMKEHDIGSLPVGENDRLIGMVTDRDITCRAVADGRDKRMVGILSLGDISHATSREMSGEVIAAVSAHHAR